MPGRLYPTHMQLAPAPRLLLSAGSALGAFLYPQRADLVAAAGELTGQNAFKAIRARMEKDMTGMRILEERPLIDSDFYKACSAAPYGSFGEGYSQFMQRRNFKAEERPPVRFVDDAELAYVALRYRQVHDLWHVLLGLHTNLLGETALKAVEFAQTGLPMTAAAVVAGYIRLKKSEQVRLQSELLPWAARAGVQCTDLMSIYYEEHVSEDLRDLRQRWRIIPAPECS